MIPEGVGVARTDRHEEVVAAAGDVDTLLLVGGADREVELGVEAELADFDAVVGDEGRVFCLSKRNLLAAMLRLCANERAAPSRTEGTSSLRHR